MSRPDVAIIMANYNFARYLPAAIRSIMRQTLTTWELIIVDDGSADDSVETARRVAAGDPRIKIIPLGSNRGAPAACNVALENATAHWMAVVDSDDLILPHRLEHLLSRAIAEDATILADGLQLFSESSAPWFFLPRRMRETASWIDLAQFILSNCLYSRTPPLGYLKPLIRLDAVRAHGVRYDERLRVCYDYYFVARLMSQGYRMRLLPEALYLYRKHGKSLSHRLPGAEIGGMLAADERFIREIAPLSPDLAGAFRQRRRTLQSLEACDQVVSAIKRGALVEATTRAVARPHMWPLLALPLAARMKRLRSTPEAPARYASAGTPSWYASVGLDRELSDPAC